MRSRAVVLRIFITACISTVLLFSNPLDFEEDRVEPQPAYETNGYSSTAYRSPPTLTSLKRQIERQNERIDGLTTLVEGLSRTLFELQKSKGIGSSEHSELLKKLAEMIDKINSEYVSRTELEQILVSRGISSKPEIKKKDKTSLDGKSNAILYSEGVRLFGKRRYSEAKKRFMFTEEKRYKPAASNYYLGEIAYYTKQYKDAIFYFKKSAGLYDKASYIDVLLLHTAISLDKTGKKDQAKQFYKNIIENYNDRKSAKIAKEKLKKL